ncbi:hypothetical protein H696_00772 [Fonticula alba]|uniref:Uncharacterized protein n=1 Tax=Fonticula alba TaxID=691883 RepID=A0A058ZFR3_FONAL|nr:hypothetical protein H696_00772 [Fonticula alba]KCV73230.1 hypothetical protein H696_00772 [Fonticula alba]|eukprot:XP_009492931.1 hypothetical protein H696_00772 [Fonticula alba]
MSMNSAILTMAYSNIRAQEEQHRQSPLRSELTPETVQAARKTMVRFAEAAFGPADAPMTGLSKVQDAIRRRVPATVLLTVRPALLHPTHAHMHMPQSMRLTSGAYLLRAQRALDTDARRLRHAHDTLESLIHSSGPSGNDQTPGVTNTHRQSDGQDLTVLSSECRTRAQASLRRTMAALRLATVLSQRGHMRSGPMGPRLPTGGAAPSAASVPRQGNNISVLRSPVAAAAGVPASPVPLTSSEPVEEPAAAGIMFSIQGPILGLDEAPSPLAPTEASVSSSPILNTHQQWTVNGHVYADMYDADGGSDDFGLQYKSF